MLNSGSEIALVMTVMRGGLPAGDGRFSELIISLQAILVETRGGQSALRLTGRLHKLFKRKENWEHETEPLPSFPTTGSEIIKKYNWVGIVNIFGKFHI